MMEEWTALQQIKRLPDDRYSERFGPVFWITATGEPGIFHCEEAACRTLIGGYVQVLGQNRFVYDVSMLGARYRIETRPVF